MSFILWMLIISVAINLLMFIPAYFYRTDKLTDLSYAITFIIIALVGYFWSQKSIIHLIGFLIIAIWALRLGIFLFIRIRKLKKDARFDSMREKFLIFMRFWLLQGVTVFIVLIPCILLWQQEVIEIKWLSMAGVVIFIIGLLIESVADFQKYQFYNKKSGLWIDTGIWRASRHPNYLGEIILWIGVYIFVMPFLTTDQKILALVGPIYISLLLIFVSGIPLLEKSANKKWGTIKAYRKYKSKVPVLVPTLSSIRRSF